MFLSTTKFNQTKLPTSVSRRNGIAINPDTLVFTERVIDRRIANINRVVAHYRSIGNEQMAREWEAKL